MKNHNVLPKSPIGKAFGYSLSRWDKLSTYLYDGNLEIDNNLIENAIRPIVSSPQKYYDLEAGKSLNSKIGKHEKSFKALRQVSYRPPNTTRATRRNRQGAALCHI